MKKFKYLLSLIIAFFMFANVINPVFAQEQGAQPSIDFEINIDNVVDH